MQSSTREGAVFQAVEDFKIINCYKCGMPFGVPDRWKQNRMKDQESFYCPNGHRQAYSESSDSRLRKEVERKERELEQERAAKRKAARERDAIRKSHRKMRERVKNGVCPCCNRTFQNLLQHMRTKHADLGEPQTLRKLRESYGMTQTDLAEEIGVQNNHISCFETGRHVTSWALDQIEAWIAEQE